MDTIEKILSNLFVFQIITDLFKVTIGAGLCFGALKWRKGLLSSTAIGWGAFLGAVVSALIADYFGAAGVIVWADRGTVLLSQTEGHISPKKDTGQGDPDRGTVLSSETEGQDSGDGFFVRDKGTDL